MNAAAQSSRPKLLIAYLLIWLAVTAVTALVVLAEMFLGSWTGWITAPLCFVAILAVGRKVLADTGEMPAAKQHLARLAGSYFVVNLVGAFSLAVTEGINPYNALNLVAVIVFINGWLLVALLALARWALTRRHPVLSVARQTLDEARGLRVVNGFFLLFLLLIPMLVFLLSPDQPIRYRIQQFMTYGLGISQFLLAAFVILFGAWTLTSEFTGRQAQVSLVKPIGRGAFWLGKWLGMVILSGVLLGIAALTVYLFTVFYLARQPALDELDALLVKQEVLTARVASPPQPPDNLTNRVDKRMEEMLSTDTGRSLVIERGGQAAVRNEMLQRELAQWRSIGPYRQSERWHQDYYFTDLRRAARQSEFLSLRYKIKVKGDWGVTTKLFLVINDKPYKQIETPLDIVQRQPIPSRLVDDEGRLKITVVNLDPKISVIFPADHLELLYTVDRFGPNYLRGMVIVWIKLSFVAVLVLSLSTYLGFAVASLASGLVWAVATFSPYLLEAAGRFSAKPEDAETVRWATSVVRWVATSVAWLGQQYAAYQPIDRLAEGLYIGWDQLLGCAGWIGLAWSLPLALKAWVVFRRRELAHVQV